MRKSYMIALLVAIVAIVGYFSRPIVYEIDITPLYTGDATCILQDDYLIADYSRNDVDYPDQTGHNTQKYKAKTIKFECNTYTGLAVRMEDNDGYSIEIITGLNSMRFSTCGTYPIPHGTGVLVNISDTRRFYKDSIVCENLEALSISPEFYYVDDEFADISYSSSDYYNIYLRDKSLLDAFKTYFDTGTALYYKEYNNYILALILRDEGLLLASFIRNSRGTISYYEIYSRALNMPCTNTIAWEIVGTSFKQKFYECYIGFSKEIWNQIIHTKIQDPILKKQYENLLKKTYDIRLKK